MPKAWVVVLSIRLTRGSRIPGPVFLYAVQYQALLYGPIGVNRTFSLAYHR